MITNTTPQQLAQSSHDSVIGHVYVETVAALEMGALVHAHEMAPRTILYAVMGADNVEQMKARGIYHDAVQAADDAAQTVHHWAELEDMAVC